MPYRGNHELETPQPTCRGRNSVIGKIFSTDEPSPITSLDGVSSSYKGREKCPRTQECFLSQ